MLKSNFKLSEPFVFSKNGNVKICDLNNEKSCYINCNGGIAQYGNYIYSEKENLEISNLKFNQSKVDHIICSICEKIFDLNLKLGKNFKLVDKKKYENALERLNLRMEHKYFKFLVIDFKRQRNK